MFVSSVPRVCFLRSIKVQSHSAQIYCSSVTIASFCYKRIFPSCPLFQTLKTDVSTDVTVLLFWVHPFCSIMFSDIIKLVCWIPLHVQLASIVEKEEEKAGVSSNWSVPDPHCSCSHESSAGQTSTAAAETRSQSVTCSCFSIITNLSFMCLIIIQFFILCPWLNVAWVTSGVFKVCK